MAPIPIPLPSPSPSSSLTTSSSQLLSRLSRLSKRTFLLLRRQASIVATTYGNINNGPSPGTVVGIVLGSVAGFVLLLWLLYTCLNINNVSNASSYTESVVVRDRRKSHAGSHRSRRMSETVEVRRERSRTPVRVVREEIRREPVRESVIVEERRETRRERSRSRDEGSDEVVVIEEHSPPRRTKSKRERESVEIRRESGYRTVDPLAYAGGASVGRKSSRRSGR